MNRKIAVILFNLGGPDSKEAIEPFLMNFFMDRNIVNIPLPFRFLLAKFISKRRSKKEAGEAYHKIGDRSPLLDNTKEQAAALEKTLNAQGNGNTYRVRVCMRYWHPMAPEIVREIQSWDVDKVILLPLYPQFSTTTTWSSLGNWKKGLKQHHYSKTHDYSPETSMICCYPGK